MTTYNAYSTQSDSAKLASVTWHASQSCRVRLNTHYELCVCSGDEKLVLKLPTSFQEAVAVKATLELYKETCSLHIIALMIFLYLFLQASYILLQLSTSTSDVVQCASHTQRRHIASLLLE